MGRAKNTLNAADVSSTPIKVKYAVSYPSSSLLDYGITVRSGSNIPYNVTMSSAQMQSMNNYKVIKQLYYQQAISASLGSASFWDPFWVSTIASGAYDSTIYKFPTNSGSQILIFTIPSLQFGEQVSRNTFKLASTGSGAQYRIVDDGNGNLIDQLENNKHVGNVFYGQGIAVITDEEYIIPPVSVDFITTQADDPLITQNSDNIITQ